MLPKMDYEEGIPDHSRTLVVVPTMFNSPENVKKQIENLEIRSLANPDPELQFLLLSDFTDSASEYTENDDAIIEAAKVSIKELNQNTLQRTETGFIFFIAKGFGMKRKVSGWDGRENAASWKSLTNC